MKITILLAQAARSIIKKSDFYIMTVSVVLLLMFFLLLHGLGDLVSRYPECEGKSNSWGCAAKAEAHVKTKKMTQKDG